jgi:hypothetical protein
VWLITLCLIDMPPTVIYDGAFAEVLHMNRHTPVLFHKDKVYAWVRRGREKVFRLAQPTAKDTVLYEPWGKDHTTIMDRPWPPELKRGQLALPL